MLDVPKSKIELFISKDPQVNSTIEEELKYYHDKLEQELPFFKELSEPRQLGLIGVASHIGINDFLQFSRLLLALQAGDYSRAGYEILSATWPEKLYDVFTNIAQTIITGIFPEHDCNELDCTEKE